MVVILDNMPRNTRYMMSDGGTVSTRPAMSLRPVSRSARPTRPVRPTRPATPTVPSGGTLAKTIIDETKSLIGHAKTKAQGYIATKGKALRSKLK